MIDNMQTKMEEKDSQRKSENKLRQSFTNEFPEGGKIRQGVLLIKKLTKA